MCLLQMHKQTFMQHNEVRLLGYVRSNGRATMRMCLCNLPLEHVFCLQSFVFSSTRTNLAKQRTLLRRFGLYSDTDFDVDASVNTHSTQLSTMRANPAGGHRCLERVAHEGRTGEGKERGPCTQPPARDEAPIQAECRGLQTQRYMANGPELNS